MDREVTTERDLATEQNDLPVEDIANGGYVKAKSRLVWGGHKDLYNPDLKTASPVASDASIKC